MAQVFKEFEDEFFAIGQDEFGWLITHKESNNRIGVNYNAIPQDKSNDYVLGYAKALAYQENWINP